MFVSTIMIIIFIFACRTGSHPSRAVAYAAFGFVAGAVFAVVHIVSKTLSFAGRARSKPA